MEGCALEGFKVLQLELGMYTRRGPSSLIVIQKRHNWICLYGYLLRFLIFVVPLPKVPKMKVPLVVIHNSKLHEHKGMRGTSGIPFEAALWRTELLFLCGGCILMSVFNDAVAALPSLPRLCHVTPLPGGKRTDIALSFGR
jgi:hypothetical protein